MKFIIIFAFLASLVCFAVSEEVVEAKVATKLSPRPPPPTQSTIISSYDETLPDGIRRWGFVTSDGYAQDVILTPIAGEEGGIVYKQEGRWIYYRKFLERFRTDRKVPAFTEPDGTYTETRWIADQDGFRLTN